MAQLCAVTCTETHEYGGKCLILRAAPARDAMDNLTWKSEVTQYHHVSRRPRNATPRVLNRP